MENSSFVYYSNSLQEPAIAAKMLLYNKAIQLYDVTGKIFLMEVPLNQVKLLSRDDNRFLFSTIKDGSRIIEVPPGHAFLPELLGRLGTSDNKKSNRFSQLKIPVIAGSILLFIIIGYYLLVKSVAGLGTQFISPKKEAELGQLIYNSTVEEEKIDTRLTRMTQEFANSLNLSSQYKIRITVIDTSEINAFAIPGGDIIIYRGILDEMKHSGELVALLGHESVHVNERHSLRNILQEMTSSMVLSMVFGDLGNIGHAIAGQANLLSSLSYSRGLEEDADEMGMQLMLANGVDPKGMVYLMDCLKATEKGPSIPAFLNTHPVTSNRRKHAEKFVNEHPFNSKPREDLELSWRNLEQVILKKDRQ